MWHQNMDDSVLAKEANNLIKGERGRDCISNEKEVQGSIITVRDSYQPSYCQAGGADNHFMWRTSGNG